MFSSVFHQYLPALFDCVFKSVSFPSDFVTKSLYVILTSLLMYATRPTYLNILHLITVIVYVGHRLVISFSCNFLHPVASPLRSVLPNHLRSPLNARNQVPPHTRQHVNILYVLIFCIHSLNEEHKIHVAKLSCNFLPMGLYK